MKITREDILRAVSTFVQPLSQGQFTDSVTGALAKLKAITENKVSEHNLAASPFGFISNPSSSIKAFVLNLMGKVMSPVIVAHFDQNRPTDLAQGETCVYSGSGYRVVWRNGEILIGKGSTLEPAVMGTTLQSFLSQFSQLIEEHTHAGPGAPPTNVTAITQLRQQQIDNGKILAEDGGRF